METTNRPEPPDLYAVQARMCQVMGHPVRLRILHMLHERGGEMGAAEIRQVLGIPKGSLSQHLSKMTDAGLVEPRREGRYLFVRLACPEVGQACHLVRSSLIERFRAWAGVLGSR